MSKFLLKIFSDVVRFILSLRYKIELKGLDKIEKTTGVLVLPNHPAEIDPVIMSILLWRKLQPSPIVLEDFYNMPVLNKFFKLIGALPMPDMETGRSQFKIRRINKTLDAIANGLSAGKNYLIYPSGRLTRDGQEIIGGASALHSLLEKAPRANILLARTRGLWGSSFSYAFDGKRPDLVKRMLFGALILFLNLLFLTPRRKVTIEFLENPKDFPRSGTRAQQNHWLENWYNELGAEQLQLVPYYFWTKKVPKITGEISEKKIDVSDIPQEIQKGVIDEFVRMTGRTPEAIKPEMQLRKDLGLDSLEMADVIDWLDLRFGVLDVSLVDLTTVGAVMLIAAGKFYGDEKNENNKISGWGKINVQVKILPPNGKTIQECFLNNCERMKNHPAIADDLSGVLSYKKVKIAALALAGAIKNLPGNKIGIMLPASVGANIVFAAVSLAGKIPVMINWTLGEKNLRHVVEIADIKVILTSMRFVDNLDNVAFDEIEDLLIFLEDLKREKINLKCKIAALLNSLKATDKLLSKFNLNNVSENDTAVLLFTSGSEAKPKGVPLSHKNLLTNIRDCSKVLNFRGEDVLYGFLPPFHSFGLTVTSLLPMLTGLRAAYYPNPTESRKLARGIKNWKITLVPGTPTFVAGIIKAARENQLNSVRIFVAGAEKAPDDLFRAVDNLKTNAKLLEGYGITECSPVVSITRPSEPAEGVGRPLDSVEVCVMDLETRKILELGARGLFLVRGDSVFNGYYGKNPPNPFVEIDGKSWYNTGDLGFINENGALIIVGRLKRFIKIAGEMISLPAIEDALKIKLPADEEGKPKIAIDAREEAGKRPEIILFTTENISVEEANGILRQSGIGNLSRIGKVEILEEIPLLGTGKIDYQTLKKYIS